MRRIEDDVDCHLDHIFGGEPLTVLPGIAAELTA